MTQVAHTPRTNGDADLHDWRTVYEFWFPPSFDQNNSEALRLRLEWWMRGGATAELPPFASMLSAARAGQLDRWRSLPLGRLSLLIVLDQFPRGLFAGTAQAYTSDTDALRIAEDGMRNGHYDALTSPWEKFFFFLPLAHAEGPDHAQRMKRVVSEAEAAASQAPLHLQPIFQFSLSQAQANLDVISRYGRFPHRNAVLARSSTPEELTYLKQGDFVHRRQLPGALPREVGVAG